LEDGKVLSIRVVDISKQTSAADFNHTLRFYLADRIKPGCIAFSDSKEHDVLSAFILTEKNHLYTLTLRPDHFRKPPSTEDDILDLCKSYLSGQFAFRKPLRLVKLSADELLVSYQDGELTRLSRKAGGDGTPTMTYLNVLHADQNRVGMGRISLSRKSMVYWPELF
jgi:nuclear pore complex protein Nup160